MQADSVELEQILASAPLEVTRVLAERERYRVRILYTQIDRDSENRPRFTSHGLGLGDKRYFYPASTVKLPVAALALERLNDLGIPGLDRKTSMLTDRSSGGQTEAHVDPTTESGLPSVEQYVKKIFIVSDNDAYNRLYEFLGQAAIRESLREKGHAETQILRRLSVTATASENRTTNPIRFVDGDRVLYSQPERTNPKFWSVERPDVRQGRGHYVGGELVEQPIDFRHSNDFPLEEQQAILRTLLFPTTVPVDQRFRLAPEDRRLLLEQMSMLPRESESPVYGDRTTYYDSYGKFFLFGDSQEPIPGSIRIFNKVGQAYGYLLDNAYVVDFEHGIEFLLTAVLQVNDNEIYNDDTYEYDEVGYPFLAALGRTIYEHEMDRSRADAPDLSPFDLHGYRQP